MDGCEINRDAAYKVNALGPRNLALACEKINARLIHISTDYVFSGTANGGIALDEVPMPAPISAYGQTKLWAKSMWSSSAAATSSCARLGCTATTAKTLSRPWSTWQEIRQAERCQRPVGNPTNAVDLAYHILKLAVSHDYGIYHCTGNGICSWYDFASEIIRLSGLPCTVNPCTSAQYKAMNPRSAPDRPAWSALENRMLRCTVGDDMRDWKDAIQDFLQ